MKLSLRRVPDATQGSVIKFSTVKNKSAAEIHRQLSSVYGEEKEIRRKRPRGCPVA